MPPLTGELFVDGGAAANDLLLYLQASSANRTVARPAHIETTALGAAYLAGLAHGVWSSVDELRSLRAIPTLFEPGQEELSIDRPTWRRAVERTRGWAAIPSDA